MTKTTRPKAAGKKVKARKTVAKTTRKVVKPATHGMVYAFQPRNTGAASTMETLMTTKNKFDRMTQDATGMQKEQIDALIKSGTITVKGMEDIFRACMQVVQTSAEKNSQAFKSLVGCRTLNEFTETHNRLAQQNFDDFMSTATRLSELAVKVATDAFEPLNDQFSRSIKKASDAVAA